jgi:hypothetical protein
MDGDSDMDIFLLHDIIAALYKSKQPGSWQNYFSAIDISSGTENILVTVNVTTTDLDGDGG